MLLTTLGAILILSPLARSACHRCGMPSSVGFVTLGLVIGYFVRQAGPASPELDAVFDTLAKLGIVALLFRVGLRSHVSVLLEKLPDASLIWIANVLGCLAVGYLVARFGLGWSVETSLVIATAFTATSVAVSVSVWDELGKLDSDQGQMLIDVAELDDLSAAVLLAVLLGTLPALMNGSDGIWFEMATSSVAVIAKLALFVFGCYLFAQYVEKRFTDFSTRVSDSESSLTISILGAGLAIAAIADFLGFSIAIGALFAGLAFSRDPEAVRTDGGFTWFYDLLTPFFFIHIGMQTDVIALLHAVDVAAVLFVAAVLAKLAFTALPALRSMGGGDSLRLGVSMVPRAEIALVVLYACRAIDERIVSEEVFASMVLVSLASCIVAPVLLRQLLARP